MLSTAHCRRITTCSGASMQRIPDIPRTEMPEVLLARQQPYRAVTVWHLSRSSLACSVSSVRATNAERLPWSLIRPCVLVLSGWRSAAAGPSTACSSCLLRTPSSFVHPRQAAAAPTRDRATGMLQAHMLVTLNWRVLGVWPAELPAGDTRMLPGSGGSCRAGGVPVQACRVVHRAFGS